MLSWQSRWSGCRNLDSVCSRARLVRHHSALSFGHLHILMKTLTAVLLLVTATLTLAGDKLFDERLAKDAVAVLRVHKAGDDRSLPKYPLIRYQVGADQVFKNESRWSVNHDFAVHGFKGMEGVPPGECTIYITRYHVAN